MRIDRVLCLIFRLISEHVKGKDLVINHLHCFLIYVPNIEDVLGVIKTAEYFTNNRMKGRASMLLTFQCNKKFTGGIVWDATYLHRPLYYQLLSLSSLKNFSTHRTPLTYTKSLFLTKARYFIETHWRRVRNWTVGPFLAKKPDQLLWKVSATRSCECQRASLCHVQGLYEARRMGGKTKTSGDPKLLRCDGRQINQKCNEARMLSHYQRRRLWSK